MELALSQEDFKEIVKLLPQLLRNKLLNSQFVPSVFTVLKEELTMEQLQELHGELFRDKTFKEKSFTSFSEFLSNLPASESEELVFTKNFINEIRQIEEIVTGAGINFKKYSGKLLENINTMIDDHKNQIIEKVIYDRIRPFENIRSIFNMRYAFISGTKDKNALFEDLKGILGPWLCGKVQFPEKVTLKQFNLFYNSKTAKPDQIFAELV